MQMHILALLICFQTLVACAPDRENTQPVAAASIHLQAMAGNWGNPEKAWAPAENIVFKSADNGQSWQDISAGLPNGLQPGGVFVVGDEIFLGTGNGVFRSSITETPKWRHDILLYGGITEVAPGKAGAYACSYEKGLFQNVPGTDLWINRSENLSDKMLLSVLETADGAVFVSGENGIYKSANGGQSWKQVYAGGLVVDLVESDGVLIGGGAQGALRSTDGGENWEIVLNEDILIKKTRQINDRFFAILGTRDATKINPEGITSRLRASADGGKTWERMDKVLLPLRVYDMDERLSETKDIYDIVQVGKYLFCSFDTGIYRSSDQGKRWELVLKGAFNLAVSGQVVYAVPAGGC